VQLRQKNLCVKTGDVEEQFIKKWSGKTIPEIIVITAIQFWRFTGLYF